MSLFFFYVGLVIVSFLVGFIGAMIGDGGPTDIAVCAFGCAIGIPLVVQYFI